MKNRKENYITKPILDKALRKTENKLISMMGTMEGRIMGNMAEAIGLSEKKIIGKMDELEDRLVSKFTLTIKDTAMNSENGTRAIIREMGDRIMEKFDSLDQRYVLRKEFFGV